MTDRALTLDVARGKAADRVRAPSRVRHEVGTPRHPLSGSIVETMIRRPFKEMIDDSILYPWVQKGRERLRGHREAQDWLASGGDGPPPHLLKQGIVRSYARRHNLRTLIETGTYQGSMVAALERDFDRIVSIEVDETLCRKAEHRFAGSATVTIVRGDSMHALPTLLERLTEPALFWLDGHFSGGETSRGLLDTPIVHEVECVLKHAIRGHAVLIDDARLFVGTHDYPTLEALRTQVAGLRPDLNVEVAHDIIRIS